MIRTISLPFLSLLLMAGIANGQSAYITNSGNTVTVINVATNTIAGIVEVGNGCLSACASPDGKKVYVVNNGDNTVSVVSTARKTVTATIPVGAGPVGIAVSHDGSKVYVANNDNNAGNTVSVINNATDSVTETITVGRGPWDVAVTPDGRKLYVTNYQDSTVSVVNTATNSVLTTIPIGVIPFGIAVSPDGTKVYVTNINFAAVTVINVANDSIEASVLVDVGPYGLAVTPDGSKVYVANAVSNTVSVISTSSNTESTVIRVGKQPFGVSVSPDGSKVYVENFNDHTISVISMAGDTVAAVIPIGSSPDGLDNFMSTYTPCSVRFNRSIDTLVSNHHWITDKATGVPPYHYEWNWGDSFTDTIPYPAHCYLDTGDYVISLTITDKDSCQSTFSDSLHHIIRTPKHAQYINVIPDAINGMKSTYTKNVISVYPDSVSNTLIIHSQLSILNSQLIITNTTGKEVYNQPISYSPQSAINISQWNKGLYLYQVRIQVQTGKEEYTGRFIKE
jgi:YVTN family beta-propeller protein